MHVRSSWFPFHPGPGAAQEFPEGVFHAEMLNEAKCLRPRSKPRPEPRGHLEVEAEVGAKFKEA